MAEQQGDKTEQATPRRLEDAWNKGQFARSAEVQTVFVLFAALTALLFTGQEIWQLLGRLMCGSLAHLHDTAVTFDNIVPLIVGVLKVAGACVWPILVATAVGGLLGAGAQSRFRTAPDALEVNWDRINPINGFKKIFSIRSAVPSGIALVKLVVIVALSYNVIATTLRDPIFTARWTSCGSARSWRNPPSRSPCGSLSRSSCWRRLITAISSGAPART